MTCSSLLWLALLALAGTASSLLVMPKRSNGTLLTMQLDSHSDEIDSGTTAYRFPGSTAAAWELLTPSGMDSLVEFI